MLAGATGVLRADGLAHLGVRTVAADHVPGADGALDAHAAREAEGLEGLDAAGLDRQASGRDIPTVIHVPMPLQPDVTPWRYLAPQSRQENRPQE